MVKVGIKDLKNQLSQYLVYVKAGKKVLVTEHGRVVAELAPPSKYSSHSDVEAELNNLADQGKLIRAKRSASVQLATETAAEVDWVSIYQDNRAR